MSSGPQPNKDRVDGVSAAVCATAVRVEPEVIYTLARRFNLKRFQS